MINIHLDDTTTLILAVSISFYFFGRAFSYFVGAFSDLFESRMKKKAVKKEGLI